MKTILIPVDYSPGSTSALLYGLKMARKAHLKVVVLHAFYSVISPPAAYDVPFFISELEAEKTRELEKYVKESLNAPTDELIFRYSCAKLAAEGEEPVPFRAPPYHAVAVEEVTHKSYAAHVTCLAKMGSVYEQTQAAAEAYGVDLIVMGLQWVGATLGNALIGSTTLSLMRSCPVPVLGVPPKAIYSDLKKVVFATDLRQQPDRQLLSNLRGFVSTFRSMLQVLHIDREQDLPAVYIEVQDALNVLDRALYDVEYKVILQYRKKVAAGIQEYLQAQKINLLIIGPRHHSFLDKLLHASVTATLVGDSLFPLLTLPETDTEGHPGAEDEVEKTQLY